MARYERPGVQFSVTFDSPTSGLTGTFGVKIVRSSDAVVIVPRTTAGIVEAPAGSGLYTYTGITPAVGSYLVVGDDGTNTPAGTTAEALIVTTSGLPTLPAASVGLGPCSLWTTPDLVGACCDGLADGADLDYAVQVASAMLYEMSGRRYAGRCRAVVRPQNRYESCGPLGWWTYNSWPAGCRRLSDVVLAGYPVREVEEVKLDGDVLDPAEYMLVGGRRLLRTTEGSVWPSCQYLERADTEPGTFVVTYTYGADPPLLGRHAASKLACEIAKACGGGACALPANVSRVVREGVEVAVDASREFPGGFGLQEVEVFLRSVPGRQRRSVVTSPDARRYPLVISTGPAD